MCSCEHIVMSLGITDIRLMHHAPVGVLPARFTIDLGVSESIRGPGDTSEAATKRAIRRIYGNIADEFEKFVSIALPGGVPPDAQEACERIRAMFRGEGPSCAHHAPENSGAVRVPTI
jgi:hypothetical protein